MDKNYSYNLLVVDDDTEITNSLFQRFHKQYNVFIAKNGHEAIAIIEKNNIQIVISDKRTPDLPNLDFYGLIKSKYPDAVKVSLSDYDDMELIIGAIHDGQIYRYLAKPWNLEALSELLAEAASMYELITKNRRLNQHLYEHPQQGVRNEPEDELRAVIRRLELSKESAGIGIWDLDLKHNNLVWDKQMFELYGIQANDFGGAYEAWKRGVHPDDITRTDAEVKAAIAGKAEFHTQFRVIWPDGQVRYIEAHAAVISDSEDRAERITGVNWDITKSKLAEEALLENQKRYEKAQSMGRVGNWEYSPATTNFWASDEAKKIYGFELDSSDFSTSRVESCIPERERVHQALVDLIEHDKEYDLVFDVITYDKGIRKTIHSIAEAERDARGKAVKITGVINDITRSKQAELTQKETIDRLNFALETANEGFWEWDFSSNRIALDKLSLKMLGYEADLPPVDAEIWINRVHPDYKTSLLGTFNDFRSGKKPTYNYEFPMQKKDGTYIWVASTARVFRFDSKGDPLLIVGIHQNITERKEAAKALLISEQRYNLAMKASKDGLFDWNLITNEIYYSASYKSILGYENSELPNDFSVWENLTHPDDVSKSWEMLSEVINKKRDRFELEFKMKHKDGHWVDILSRADAVFDDKGKAVKLIGTHIDITARKQAEMKLISAKKEAEENENKFRTLFSELKEGVTLTHNGILVDLNDIMLTKLGFQSKEEVIGKSLLDFMTEESKQIACGEIKKIQSNKIRSSHREFVFNSKNGKAFIVAMNGSKIEFKGKTYGLSVHHDITESKRVEAELVKAKEKAEESDRLKSAFLANMSHEIRTPMNGILGFTNLLKQPGLAGEDQQKYIRIIERSGNRMLDTISNIIDISRLESGQVSVSVSEIDLNAQLDELLEFFRPEAESKNIHLSVSARPSHHKAIIISDREKLNSILTNLIKNAIKYTHEGNIQFGCSINEKGKQTELEFFVKDTGIGIPKNRQEAIFDRFVQADIEDKQVFQGSGLGLAISKAYIQMLGGKIWVESKEGLGSQFSFTIANNVYDRKALQGNMVNSSQPSLQQSAKKRFKVLVVDDEEYVITYFKIILEKYTKEILVATTGIEAVEICRNNPDIDIVLMDIKIPEISGYEATRRIREFNKDVFILAQTAFAQAGDREKSLKAGCDDYITKPIKKGKLLEIMGGHFKIYNAF